MPDHRAGPEQADRVSHWTPESEHRGVLLVETVRKAGLDTAISAALTPWRKARAVHDPGKILLDVALAVALATASRMSSCCGPSRPCSGQWPPTRRSPASSTPLPPPGRRPCGPSVPHGPKSADMSGGWPTGERLMRAGR